MQGDSKDSGNHFQALVHKRHSYSPKIINQLGVIHTLSSGDISFPKTHIIHYNKLKTCGVLEEITYVYRDPVPQPPNKTGTI